MNKMRVGLLAIGFLAFAACASTGKNLDKLSFKAADVFPEGIAALPDGSGFLVTSLRKGRVGMVDWQGNYKVFIDDENLISVLGVKVDAERNWVLLANGDPGVSEKRQESSKPAMVAGLGIYELDSGALVKYIDLAAVAADGKNHIANDIVVAPNGDIFVTDSFSPIIYKVDRNMKASVFARMPKLWSGKGFSLNGLVYENGYLLVAKYNSGELFRISASDSSDVQQVKLEQPLIGADGLVLLDDKVYVVAALMQPKAMLAVLTSDDDWNSAKLVESKDISSLSQATTATSFKGKVYYIDAKLNILFGGNSAEEFTIYTY